MLNIYDDYEVVEEIGQWAYDWTIGALLRDKATGELFFGVDSGCSCTGFGDGLDREDLIPVKNWQQAVEEAKKYLGYGDTPVFTESEVYEFAKRLAG